MLKFLGWLASACIALIVIGALANNGFNERAAPKIAEKPPPAIHASSTGTGTDTLSVSAAEAPAPSATDQHYDVVLYFPVDKYPGTAAHIQEAIAEGESSVCTINRDGADENREESLEGIPTKSGYDRDEWPMAMCAEGGEGADVAYVPSSDNRGSGSWVGSHLENYADGTKVLFILDDEASGEDEEAIASSGTPPLSPDPAAVSYKNCSAVRAAHAAPLYEGDPGYSTKLDRDRDGVACE